MIDISTKIINDFAKVEKAANRASVKALRSSGAYLRKVARNSIKSKTPPLDGKRKPSEAGKPPYSWKQPGMTFKDSILYAVEDGNVVVGPMGWGRGKKVGQIQEFGGTASITMPDDDGNKKSVLATYPKRPYMAPALERSQSKISEFWRNSIR